VLRLVVDRVIIVAHDPARYPGLGVPVVGDLVPDAGALGGIYTALAVAEEPVLVIACDMPFLTAPFLARVMEAAQDADVAVPRDAGGYHPLCACYTQACAEPIRRRLDAGALKVLDLFGDVHVRTIDPVEIAVFDPDGLLLLNINTPGDLARAQRGRDRMSGHHPS
jgi:molybdopterin-guanine dinucleotide biosynthesis protein A